MKICSTSLVTEEMQIKSTMRNPVTPVKMAIIRKSTNSKCWRGCGEKERLISWCNRMHNSMKPPQKTENRTTLCSSHPIPRHIAGENYNSKDTYRKEKKRYTHPRVHCSTIYNSQTWKQPKYLSKEEHVKMQNINKVECQTLKSEIMPFAAT